ncbi:MAG: hypothetical protein A3J80_11595 [Desulfobacula sp. RIFOXYB2_FULL_45_6]|nr:MAG: hypothetical protein A3J80_11595 [Desulfobacula sp. RIFOXYB2_FULL_45_6]
MIILNDKKKNPGLISLLYVTDAGESGEFKKFSTEKGFALEICNDFQTACDISKSKQPDLIILESDNNALADRLIRELSASGFHSKPAVFLCLSEYPLPDLRVKLLRDGVDHFLIKPFLSEEVKEKIGFFFDKENVSRLNHTLSQKLGKTTDYLKRFKQELKQTKTELYEERLALNQALKQVNRMANERIRFKKDIKNIKGILETNMEGVSEILAGLIKERIEKSRGHGERVARIADFLAEQLKIDEKRQKDLRKAAMLHETGLLFVPEVILRNEKDQLPDFEKDLIMQYPVKGAGLLSTLPEFRNCAEVIRHLNENSDGTGKPDGLKRKYIPLLSRVLAGADVFDTLREKDATSLEKMLTKLEEYSGTRLDPTIVSLLEEYAVLHMDSGESCIKGKSIHQLEPGMTLGTSLFTNTGTKLFSANTLLTQEAIDKIKKYSREYPVDETVYIKV